MMDSSFIFIQIDQQDCVMQCPQYGSSSCDLYKHLRCTADLLHREMDLVQPELRVADAQTWKSFGVNSHWQLP
jgi:hypothetical protein